MAYDFDYPLRGGLKPVIGAFQGLGSTLQRRYQRLQKEEEKRQQFEVQENIKGIFSAHTSLDPATGKMEPNKPAIIAELRNIGAFQMASDQESKWAQQDRAKKAGREFAKTKKQKFVGDDGFMRNYNPETGTTSFAMDETTGKKVKAQDYFKYVETPEGFVPLSTKRPPTEPPKPIPDIKPAGAKTRELRESQIILAIRQADLAIEKSARDAAMGGQFKGTQYQAATYGHRMRQSLENMDRLVDLGYDRTKATADVMSKLPNQIKGSLLQQQAQAERNFVNALLRRESGAAIAKEEFASAELQYFPRAGDSEATITQKRQNMRTAIAGMQAESGGAWQEVLNAITGMEPTKLPERTPGRGWTPEKEKRYQELLKKQGK